MLVACRLAVSNLILNTAQQVDAGAYVLTCLACLCCHLHALARAQHARRGTPLAPPSTYAVMRVTLWHAQLAQQHSLLPAGLLCSRYVRYMGNIRLIQEYLVHKADKHGLPRVENSNVDRSVAIIHLTVMG